MARVEAAVAFAEASPFPAPESLYDDVYVLDDNVRGIYSEDPGEDRAAAGGELAGVGAGEGAAAHERSANDEIPQQLTDALAVAEDGQEPAPQPSSGRAA